MVARGFRRGFPMFDFTQSVSARCMFFSRRRQATVARHNWTKIMNLKSLLSLGNKGNEIASTETSPFTSLQREIDRVFSDFTQGWPRLHQPDLTPRMDVTERGNEIAITAELPGLQEKDVKVELVDNLLTISGEKKIENETKDDKRYVLERSYGAFSRSIELPEGINSDDIKAYLVNGVLTVTLPKPPEAEPSAKQIEVKAAA